MISGAITAFVIVAIIMLGSTKNKHQGLPFRVDGCSNDTMTRELNQNVWETGQRLKVEEEENTFILFKLSNMYYTFLGTTIVFIVAYVVSLLTGGYEVKDERLFTPFVRKRPEQQELQNMMKNTQYLNIKTANKVVISNTDNNL